MSLQSMAIAWREVPGAPGALVVRPDGGGLFEHFFALLREQRQQCALLVRRIVVRLRSGKYGALPVVVLRSPQDRPLVRPTPERPSLRNSPASTAGQFVCRWHASMGPVWSQARELPANGRRDPTHSPGCGPDFPAITIGRLRDVCRLDRLHHRTRGQPGIRGSGEARLRHRSTALIPSGSR